MVDINENPLMKIFQQTSKEDNIVEIQSIKNINFFSIYNEQKNTIKISFFHH